MPSDTRSGGLTLAVGLLAVGETLVWAGLFYVFAALFVAWETDLGWAKTDLTLGITLAIFASALAAPIAGRIIDAGHGKALMCIGALTGAASLAGLSQIETRAGFTALWVLIGTSQAACLYEACFSFVTRTLGDQARFAITRITLVAGLASTLAFPAAGLLAPAFGWRVTVLTFAAVVAFVAAPLLYLGGTLLEQRAPLRAPTPPRAENKAAVKRAMARREFWLIALVFALVALNHGTILNHILPIFTDRGASLWMATAAASLIGPSQVMGRLVILRYELRLGSVTMTMIALGIACVAAFVLLLAGLAPPLIFLFAVLQGGAFGVFSILRPVMVADILGRTAFGAISARTSVPYLVAIAASPYLGALVWQVAGYNLVIACALGFSMLALSAAYVLRKSATTSR